MTIRGSDHEEICWLVVLAVILVTAVALVFARNTRNDLPEPPLKDLAIHLTAITTLKRLTLVCGLLCRKSKHRDMPFGLIGVLALSLSVMASRMMIFSD